jgi:hypothetical protein
MDRSTCWTSSISSTCCSRGARPCPRCRRQGSSAGFVGAAPGPAVRFWLDQSPLKNHAVEGVVAKQPQLVSAALGGKAVLAFDGIDDSLDLLARLVHSQQFTLVLVGKSKGSGFREFVSNWDVSNTLTSVFFGQADSTLRFTDDFFSAGSFAEDTYAIFAAVSSSSDARTYLNGVLAAAKASALSARDLTTTWRIGTQGGAYEFLDGAIAEVLVYDRALPDAERRALELVLKKRYGL